MSTATYYERLSPLDASFLALESGRAHFHVASVAILDAGPLRTADGGIDINRIRAFIASRLKYVPRYRQRLAWTPLGRSPIWVDADHFDLEYHVRHTSLPRPGAEAQLKRLAGRVLSQQLDRAQPLWEFWVAEGLDDDHFALIAKVHHCMIDGIAGVDLMAVLFGVSPNMEIEPPDEWQPRPAPEGAQLMVAEAARRTRRMTEAVRTFGRRDADASTAWSSSRHRVQATAASLASGWLRASSMTPLNGDIGPNRRFDWFEVPLSEVKEVKQQFGGSVNDVILAVVAGGIRRFLTERRSFPLADLDFRVMAPVSVRPGTARGEMGNQVAMWLVRMPLAEGDPVRRLRAITAETSNLKETDQALGAATIVQLSAGAPTTLVGLGARLAGQVLRPFNLTVTNVPGPQFPMYLMESRVRALYAAVPLWEHHGAGIALFSYDGRMGWGVQADWDIVPDLPDLIAALRDSHEQLLAAARRAASPPPDRRRATRKAAPEDL
jgi:diacylglycerol O-acyltransferase / wax synthase